MFTVDVKQQYNNNNIISSVTKAPAWHAGGLGVESQLVMPKASADTLGLVRRRSEIHATVMPVLRGYNIAVR